ncbi:hypothetical protein PO909_024268 [Leuciscus waleckii]
MVHLLCKCPGRGEGVSGKPTAETWPWFVLMDKVLGQRHCTNPTSSSPQSLRTHLGRVQQWVPTVRKSRRGSSTSSTSSSRSTSSTKAARQRGRVFGLDQRRDATREGGQPDLTGKQHLLQYRQPDGGRATDFGGSSGI